MVKGRWRIGDLTGEQAAMDAGAAVSDELWQSDYFCPETMEVRLSPSTYSGRKLRDVFLAVHEAMHYRQWFLNQAEAKIHAIGEKTQFCWLTALVVAVLCLFSGEYRAAAFTAITLGVISAIKAFCLLCVEAMTWDAAKKWMAENYEIDGEQTDEMDQIAKDGLASYVKGIFGR